jgi:hypothetical protein
MAVWFETRFCIFGGCLRLIEIALRNDIGIVPVRLWNRPDHHLGGCAKRHQFDRTT